MRSNNKKKIEAAIFALAGHMQQCVTCVAELVRAGASKADPPCADYQRMKASLKALADAERPS